MRVEIPEGELDRVRAEVRKDGRARTPLQAKPKYVKRTSVPKTARKAMSLLRASQQAAQRASTYGQATTNDAEALETALEPSAIGEEPPGDLLAECFNAGGADKGIGRIHNRFTYCQRVRITAEYWTVSPNRPPEHEGDTHATLEVFAQGDRFERRVRAFSRIQEGSVDYDWGVWDDIWVAPNVPLSLLGQCDESTDLCYATRGAPTMPWVAWDNSTDWFYWDIYSKEDHALGRDKIAAINWHVEFFTDSAKYVTVKRGSNGSRALRCDSAAYFNRFGTLEPKSCVFFEVTPRLTYMLGSNAHAVAAHILKAQKTPNETYPLLVPAGTPPPRDKSIPGEYMADNPSAAGLHRITEVLHPGEYKDNRDHKDGACYKKGPHKDLYWDTGLPTPPDTSVDQCDEYPFASTLEGAAHPSWDFSVKAVPKSDNASAGGMLQQYYLNDRILAYDYDLPKPPDINDRFYVEITAPCGSCGGPGDPEPPANVAPKVNAGPDVSGQEGAAIALNGTVTDPDDSPDITWSYALGDNTDPGMTCRFSGQNQAQTTIRCTDDGTVTVKLAADDHHHGGPVTDTATVTVTNAAPAVKIDSPKPDELFNGREPTPVTATFVDNGSNDTHTCSISFGDGAPAVQGTVKEEAGNGTCTGSHTYGYDGLGPRTIRVTLDDDDGGTAADSVRVVIYVPGAGFAVEATGLIGIPKSPDVHCPPSDSQSKATLSTPLGSLGALNVDCSLDTTQGRTVVDTSVKDANLLGGAVRIAGIESHCTASADGISRSSRVGTINGIPIGTGKGSLTIPLVATVRYNEITTNDRGQLVQNAVRITTLVQEIIIANCTLG